MRSTLLTRWVLPFTIVWLGVLASAWLVHRLRLDPGIARSGPLLSLLLGPPLVGALTLVGSRWSLRGHEPDVVEDLLLAWVMVFFVAGHLAILAHAVGRIPSLTRAVPLLVGILLVGMGALLPRLPPSSPLGVRTRATQSSPVVWGRVHRYCGGWMLGAGLGCVAIGANPGRWGPAVCATIVSAIALLLTFRVRAESMNLGGSASSDSQEP